MLSGCAVLCLVTQLCPTFATPQTLAHQAHLSIGILQARILEGLPCPPPGDLPNPGMEPRSPILQAYSLPSESPEKPMKSGMDSLSLLQRIFLTQESNWDILHLQADSLPAELLGKPTLWIAEVIFQCQRNCCILFPLPPPQLAPDKSLMYVKTFIQKKKKTPSFTGLLRTLHAILWSFYFPSGSDGKASVYNARDLGSIPGSGRFSGEGNGNPLQYSCLENPMDGGACCRLLSRGSQRVGHD